MSDLLRAVHEIAARLPEYQKRRAYADGTAGEVFAGPVDSGRLPDRYRGQFNLPFSSRPVKAFNSRVRIDSITVTGPDGQDLTRVWNERVWKPNELHLEYKDALARCTGYGDVYVVVQPAEADDDLDDGAVGEVEVFMHSPEGARMFYDPEQPRRRRFYAQSWTTEDGRIRVSLWYAATRDAPARLERKITREKAAVTAQLRDEDFVEYEPTVELPQGLPVWHLRTGSQYGTPVHQLAFGAQNALNKFSNTLNAGADGYGLPARFALNDTGTTGANPAAWDDDDGDVPHVERPIGGGQPGAPGTLTKLSNTKSVVQFEPADSKNMLAPLEFFVRAMATLTDTPLGEFEPGSRYQSGASKKQDEGGLVASIREVEERWKATTQAWGAHAMLLLGYEGCTIDIQFSDPASVDDLDGWKTLEEKRKAGVPQRQTLNEGGYPLSLVDEWLANPDPAARLALLGQLGAVVKDLGAAKALGVLADADAAALLRPVLAALLEQAGDAGDRADS